MRVGPLMGRLLGFQLTLTPRARHLCWIFGSLVECVADSGMAWCLNEQGGEGEEGGGVSVCLVSVGLFGSRAGREVDKSWGLCVL